MTRQPRQKGQGRNSGHQLHSKNQIQQNAQTGGHRTQNKRHRKIRKCLLPNHSGQHLLHHPPTIREMVAMPRLTADETVLDIGAGAGALTFLLAETAGHVIAVEQDEAFVQTLREKAQAYPNLKVVHGDFRTIKLPERPFAVVANLPFSITTPIFEKLLGPEGVGFRRGAFLIERGAAVRFTSGAAGDAKVLAWRMNHDITLCRTVPRTHFAPPPRVDAAIVYVQARREPLVPPGQYRRFCAFAGFVLRHGGLPLHVPLSAVFTAGQLGRALREAGAGRDQPAGTLNVMQWSALFRAMTKHVPPHRWPR